MTTCQSPGCTASWKTKKPPGDLALLAPGRCARDRRCTKILLVEDEPSIAGNITHALKTDGFEPVWCSAGEEALTRFASEKSALLILDVGLPDMNGFGQEASAWAHPCRSSSSRHAGWTDRSMLVRKKGTRSTRASSRARAQRLLPPSGIIKRRAMSLLPLHPFEKEGSRFAAAKRNLAHFCENVIPSLSGNWMRHSLALDHLDSIYTLAPDTNGDFGCGPVAFAAIAGITPEEVAHYFPSLEERAWTNRQQMEKALKSFGWRFTRVADAWPQLGLCLVHWRGPWTKGKYPAAMMPRTHWVAVVGDYVFDVNWRGWLPRENWEDVVVSELICQHAEADGWEPLTAYEITV